MYLLISIQPCSLQTASYLHLHTQTQVRKHTHLQTQAFTYIPQSSNIQVKEDRRMKNLYACFLAYSRCNRHTFIWGIMRFCPCCIFPPPSSVEYLHKCVYNHYLNAIKTHFSGKLDTAKSLKPFAALFIYSFQFWHCMHFSFISYTQSAIN